MFCLNHSPNGVSNSKCSKPSLTFWQKTVTSKIKQLIHVRWSFQIKSLKKIGKQQLWQQLRVQNFSKGIVWRLIVILSKHVLRCFWVLPWQLLSVYTEWNATMQSAYQVVAGLVQLYQARTLVSSVCSRHILA